MRMENLTTLEFENHLHWPQGRGRPALLIVGGDETTTRPLTPSFLPPRRSPVGL